MITHSGIGNYEKLLAGSRWLTYRHKLLGTRVSSDIERIVHVFKGAEFHFCSPASSTL
jgi:hypothetical protein